MGALHRVRRWGVRMLLLLAVLTVGSAASGDERSDAQRADAIAGRTMSPFCPGQTLNSCTSPNAARWRHDIRTWVDEGVSSEEIRHRLDLRAGRDLSAIPDAEPTRWLLGVLGMASLLALAGLARWQSRRRRGPDEPEPEDHGASASTRDALDERLDDELAWLDDS